MAQFVLNTLTSSNINRFSKFFHCLNQEKICNNIITKDCRGGPVPDRLSAALISRKFAVARACVRGPSRQADVSAAG